MPCGLTAYHYVRLGGSVTYLPCPLMEGKKSFDVTPEAENFLCQFPAPPVKHPGVMAFHFRHLHRLPALCLLLVRSFHSVYNSYETSGLI